MTTAELMSGPLAVEVIALVTELAEIDASAADPEAPLDQVGIDSLMAIEIAVHVEQRYGTSFTEDDLTAMRCLADVVRVTQARLEQS
jgi:acyl carrier protein